MPIESIKCKLPLGSSEPCLRDDDINSSVVSNQKSEEILTALENLSNKCEHDIKVSYGESNPGETLFTLCQSMQEKFEKLCKELEIDYIRQGN